MHGDDENLQFCRRPGPNAQACADAIREIQQCGLPLDGLSNGQYIRGGPDISDFPMVHRDRYDDGEREIDPSGALRSFGVKQGNRATALIVKAGPLWWPEADHGWRITRQYGPHGQCLDLER